MLALKQEKTLYALVLWEDKRNSYHTGRETKQLIDLKHIKQEIS